MPHSHAIVVATMCEMCIVPWLLSTPGPGTLTILEITNHDAHDMILSTFQKAGFAILFALFLGRQKSF